jgi:lysophospholipase L1-like esterase
MINRSWNWKTAGVVAFTLTFLPVFGANEKNYTYLALGDSVAFGVDPTLLPPFSTAVPGPDVFIGYPERVAEAQNLLKSKKLSNTSCPGESSGSFLTLGVRDLGCNWSGPQDQPPWKPTIGLRTNYPGSQMDFAQNQLLNNKHIDLVTLSIGGNDLSIVQKDCTIAANGDPAAFATCVRQKLFTELPSGELAPGEVLLAYAANLAQILARIRFDANYQGTLVLVTYYSPSADPLFVGAVAALNQVMVSVGAQFDAKIADGFAAFQLASQPDGDPCKAGLLVEFPDGSCDIHPSAKGRDLLAEAVLLAADAKTKGK